MFYLGGVGLAFFLTLLLVSKRNKGTADKILAVWLFLVSTHLFLFYCRQTNIYPQIWGAEIPFPLIHGPFLYLYTLALTNRSRSLTISLLHLIPTVATIIYIIPFLLLPLEQKIYIYDNQGVGYEKFNLIKTLTIIASGVLYVILSSITLRKHRLSIAEQFSYIEKINLRWLQYLIYWIGLIWLLVIFASDDWVFAAAVLFVLFIGFFGIRQTNIFLSQEASPTIVNNIENKKPGDESIRSETSSDNAEEKRKYQKSGLSAEASAMLHQQLTQVMADEKLFRESELSLSQLAIRFNTQPNYLSQVINEQEGKNFYDYINTLRIEEFKRIVSEPDSKKYTLLALAEQCGFNSKSSFNRYFKKVTGQSPSEFMTALSDSQK